MRSELNGDYLDDHFQGEFDGRITLYWRYGDVPFSVLLTISNSHYVCMLLDHSFLACLVLMFIMPYAMFISPMTYMISI